MPVAEKKWTMYSGIKCSCAFALFFIVFHDHSNAQQQDFRGLAGFSIEKKISRSFDASVYTQVLFNQNMAELRSAFADFGVDYRLTKNISFGLDYRYSKHRNLQNFYETRQVILGDIVLSKGYKGLYTALRVRFQNQYYPDLFSENYKNNKAYNRDRLQVRYKINYYWSPFVSAEIFYPLNNPDRKFVDQVQAAAGTYYSFNDYLRAEIYYSVSHSINQSVSHLNSQNNYTINMVWYYRF